MKGVNAAALMEGQADLARETQNMKVVVLKSTPAAPHCWRPDINPVWGIGSFLAQLILRRPLLDAVTKEFLVDGTGVDPRVTEMPHKSGTAPGPRKQRKFHESGRHPDGVNRCVVR